MFIPLNSLRELYPATKPNQELWNVLTVLILMRCKSFNVFSRIHIHGCLVQPARLFRTIFLNHVDEVFPILICQQIYSVKTSKSYTALTAKKDMQHLMSDCETMACSLPPHKPLRVKLMNLLLVAEVETSTIATKKED